MKHQMFVAVWFAVLVGHVCGFNPPSMILGQRGSEAQTQTAPNRAVVPRTSTQTLPQPGFGTPGNSFLPPVPPSNPALSATVSDMGTAPTAAQEVEELMPMAAQTAREEELVEAPAEQENNRLESTTQMDGTPWSFLTGGIFGSALGAFSALAARLWRQSTEAPQPNGVELRQDSFSTALPVNESSSPSGSDVADMGRRVIVQGAALGAAVSAPKLAGAFECSPKEIDLETGKCPVPKNDVDQPHVSLAPEIVLMDHRGCSRPRTEYTGKPSGDGNDEMCVKVHMVDIDQRYTVAMMPDYKARRQAGYGWKYQDLLYTGYNGKFRAARPGDPGVDPNDKTPWIPKGARERANLESEKYRERMAKYKAEKEAAN